MSDIKLVSILLTNVSYKISSCTKNNLDVLASMIKKYFLKLKKEYVIKYVI